MSAVCVHSNMLLYQGPEKMELLCYICLRFKGLKKADCILCNFGGVISYDCCVGDPQIGYALKSMTSAVRRKWS